MLLALCTWLGLALAADPAPTAEAVDPRPVFDPMAEVRGQVDWQAHPAMHLPWPMYGKGLTERQPYLTFKHQFRQTVYAPGLRASGVRIFLAAAMAAERAKNPTQARRLILEQLAYVERFVAEHPDDFALARTPAEARRILGTTDKMVLVHSIEGGRKILTQPGDAAFWADQGVALMTLIHLLDDELGGAAVNRSWNGALVNGAGARKRRQGAPRGLTERGRAAIAELGAAGILVDLTHMSPQSVAESLDRTAALGMGPVITHGKLWSITQDERAFTDDQIVEIYRQGGSFNLILNGAVLDPHLPSLPVPAGHCPGTLDSFALHHRALRALLEGRADEALSGDFDAADPVPEHVRLASGWASDWNGWTDHSKPKVGPGRCLETVPDPQEIDLLGLAHPGLLPQHWARLAAQGVDLSATEHAAEQFLRMWERARGER